MMRTYNPYDKVSDTSSAIADLSGMDTQIWAIQDKNGVIVGTAIVKGDPDERAEAAMAIYGFGEHPDLAARAEAILQEGEDDADLCGIAMQGVINELAPALNAEYGAKIPDDRWIGRSWDSPMYFGDELKATLLIYPR